MGPSRNQGAPHSSPAEQEVREQEVRRANKELAAYFKGQRTEREARAALKIIKAFVRDRARMDPAKRRPLPAAESATLAKARPRKKATPPEKIRRRRRNPQAHSTGPASRDASDAASVKPELVPSPDE